MFTWKNIVQNYIIHHSDSIQKATAPLREHFGITYFTYHRISNDGHYSVLVDRPDWAEHYVSDAFYLEDPFLRHPDNYRSGMCLFGQHGSQNIVQRGMKAADKLLDADLQVMLIDKQADGVEFFGFSGRTLNSLLLSLYLNTPKVLKAFAGQFKKKMSSIISKMADEPIYLPDLKGADYFRQELVRPTVDSQSHYAFLNDIGKGHVVRQALSLAPRERQCLKLLLNGTSAKEIARVLGLSVRTVESYLTNMKNKLSCWNKQELFTIASEMQDLGIL